jgi:RNA polymerase sigma-B factor
MENVSGKPSWSEKATTTSRLLRAYQEHGDISARDQLIEMYLPLVESFAHRYERSEDYDDLFQAGSIGLINAIDRFDLERGGELTAFAVPNIVGEIKRHLRDRTASVRLPRPLQELRGSVLRCEAELGATLGRRPTPAEVARKLDVDPADAARILNEKRFDRGRDEDSLNEAGAEEALDLSDERLLLASAFHVLGERERQIVYLRFVRDLSRAEVAQELGISERHLSRQTKVALAKLRKELEGSPPDAEPPRVHTELRQPAAERTSARDGAPSAPPRGTPQDYLDLPYHISVVRDEGDAKERGWRARVDELPGCEAHGATLEEAVGGIRGAMHEWIARALTNEREVPEPRRAPRHSGRVLLRMPQSLHAELARSAEREDVSLNHFIANALASAGDAPGPRRSAPPSPGGSARSVSRLVPVALVAAMALVLAAGVIAAIVLVVAWQQAW